MVGNVKTVEDFGLTNILFIKKYRKMKIVYLNFNDLNEDAKEELLEVAKGNIDKWELKEECKENWRDYEETLLSRAESELYHLDIVFNI